MDRSLIMKHRFGFHYRSILEFEFFGMILAPYYTLAEFASKTELYFNLPIAGGFALKVSASVWQQLCIVEQTESNECRRQRNTLYLQP